MMAKHIGATVAFVFIVMMVLGAIILSTPMGKKTASFMGRVTTDGSMQSMLSPQNSLNCMSSGCQMPSSIGMSMLS
ncbi:MAG TPA: hypothetical protein VJP79_00905 [Nitrososphaera sp.]|nr:hypothetical protein [Nitrososphaera sp.]